MASKDVVSFKELYLEAFGAFWLTLAVAGGVLAGVGQVGTGLALGFGVAALAYATGSLGKAHYNPAITVAMWAAKKVDSMRAVYYIFSQLVGATLAALVLGAVFANAPFLLFGATTLAPGVDFWSGAVVELFLTMFLVMTVLGAPSASAPLAVGLVLAFDVFLAGGLTGASMNPARSFGPALVAGYWDNHLVYWVGPIVGALIAVGLNKWFSGKK